MSATIGKYESAVLEILGYLGISFEKIETSPSQKRCDVLARIGNEVTCIEIKDRLESEERRQTRQLELMSSGQHAVREPLGYRTAIASKVTDAAKQLNAEGNPDADFRIVWLNVEAPHTVAKAAQVRATLLGTERITGLRLPNVATCYFFGESSFFSHRTRLDGAIVAQIDSSQISAQLILNPLSDRYEKASGSAFGKQFCDSVLDPKKEEELGHFLLGVDADRASERSKLDWLANKYATGPLMTFGMGYQSLELLTATNGA